MNCAAFYVFDLVVLDVIMILQLISAWILGKIVKNLEEGQKRIAYILRFCFSLICNPLSARMQERVHENKNFRL